MYPSAARQEHPKDFRGGKAIEVAVGAYTYDTMLALVGNEDTISDWSFASTQGFSTPEEASKFVNNRPDRSLYVAYVAVRNPADGLYYVARQASGKLTSVRRSVA